jgi:ketosteroid isomerase-like protein
MLEAKNIGTPDEKHSFEHGEVEIVNLTGVTIGRATFRPGWRWSTDVKPVVGTHSCQLVHTSYVVSGRFHVQMDDGAELDLGPGDAHVVPAGHDAWVVGDEPCVTIDFAATGSFFAGRVVRCPCGVEFRVAGDDQVDHLVTAVQEHARAAHAHDLTTEEVRAEMGAGTSAAAVPDAAAVRGVIEAYGERLAAGDVDGIVALCTPDAVVMAPDLPAAVGSEQLAATYAAALEACGMEYRFEFDGVDVRGDSAVALTRTTGVTTIRSTGDSSKARYRELFVLRRTPAGWRISQYMFQPEPTQP